ncbi:MAG: hypothetical protein ABIA67_00985 [Candidatus Margulisiibacteriota bacterium]
MTGINGMGGINDQISGFVQQMGESGRIVREMYQELDDFKAEVDQTIRQKTLQRIQDRLERLQNQLGSINPAAAGQLTSTSPNAQSLPNLLTATGNLDTLTMSKGESQQVRDIQQQVRDLLDQLGSL